MGKTTLSIKAGIYESWDAVRDASTALRAQRLIESNKHYAELIGHAFANFRLGRQKLPNLTGLLRLQGEALFDLLALHAKHMKEISKSRIARVHAAGVQRKLKDNAVAILGSCEEFDVLCETEVSDTRAPATAVSPSASKTTKHTSPSTPVEEDFANQPAPVTAVGQDSTSDDVEDTLLSNVDVDKHIRNKHVGHKEAVEDQVTACTAPSRKRTIDEDTDQLAKKTKIEERQRKRKQKKKEDKKMTRRTECEEAASVRQQQEQEQWAVEVTGSTDWVH